MFLIFILIFILRNLYTSTLRFQHYELDRENLQYLALKLSCVATSLNKELLSQEKSSKVETQTMNDVTHVISMAKPLALWLDRYIIFHCLENYLKHFSSTNLENVHSQSTCDKDADKYFIRFHFVISDLPLVGSRNIWK